MALATAVRGPPTARAPAPRSPHASAPRSPALCTVHPPPHSPRLTPRRAPPPSHPPTRTGDGTYEITFTPDFAGAYLVAVTLKGEHIAGSRFALEVRPSSAHAQQQEFPPESKAVSAEFAAFLDKRLERPGVADISRQGGTN